MDLDSKGQEFSDLPVLSLRQLKGLSQEYNPPSGPQLGSHQGGVQVRGQLTGPQLFVPR